MSQTPNTALTKDFLNSLPVMGAEGGTIDIPDCTKFQSSIAPLSYSESRLVKENDYVLHIRYENDRAVSAEFAQVWATLYYDNEQPIGVALNVPNTEKSPTINMFSIRDEQGVQKRYFRTAVTLSQAEITKRILPLNDEGEKIINADEAWFRSRVAELSEHWGIASFAMALWQGNDDKKTIEYLIKSAKQGYPHTFTLLADYLKKGKGINANLNKAFEMLTKGAKAGDITAQYQLAKAYIFGQGIEPNDEQAIIWLEKATEQGNKDAYFDLGRYYRYGDFDWYRREKMQFYTFYFPAEEEAKKAFECFSTLAWQEWHGQIPAKFHLADCLDYGIGVQADPKNTIERYQDILNEGDINSQIEVEETLYRYADYRIRQSDNHLIIGDNQLAIELFQEGFKHMATLAGSYSPAKHYMASDLLLKGKPLRLKQNKKLAFELLHGLNLEELTIENQKEVKELLAREQSIMAEPDSKEEPAIITQPSHIQNSLTQKKTTSAKY